MENRLAEFQKEMEQEINQGFSETVIEHAMQPRNLGAIKDYDGHARYKGPCGDTMEIWLKVVDGTIEKAHFWTDGCGTSIASGSMVTELATGKQLDEAMEINQTNVLEALDGLPEESEHCALLAATTLKLAIADYLECRKEPWRKTYRRAP